MDKLLSRLGCTIRAVSACYDTGTVELATACLALRLDGTEAALDLGGADVHCCFGVASTGG